MKLLCVEDGSVDIDSLEEDLAYCQEKNIELQKILVYRQGSVAPFILDDKRDLKDLHQEVLEISQHIYDEGQMWYKIPATKFREIFEKHIKNEKQI